MGAVLVHIDLDGDRPHPSSLTALAAGRAVASSWGATLYAALIVHDPSPAGEPDAAAPAAQLPVVEAVRAALARAGADKVVVARTDVAIAPLWAAIGAPWQGVLDHLRPRLVLFGADAPAAAELGPRTAARIGARILMRARAIGVDVVELRDRDGGYARASDGGAAVVLVGAAPAAGGGDDDIDLIVLALPGGADPRIELTGSAPADAVSTCGAVIVIGDDAAEDAQVATELDRLARALDANVIGGAAAVRAGLVPAAGALERHTALAPELCIAIGSPVVDLAGATSLIRIGGGGAKGVDGALSGPIGAAVGELARALEEP